MAKTRSRVPQETPEAPVVRIKVRAIQDGYYDHIRRREGDVFVLTSERAFSERWMEHVDASVPERLTTGKEVLRQAHDELLRERVPGQGSSYPDESDENPLGG